MKSLKITVAVLAFAASNAFAQAAVDPEQKAAIKGLLDALNFKHMMSQMSSMMAQSMPQMMDQMVEGMASKSKLTPEQKAAVHAQAAAAREKSSRDLNELFSDPVVIQGMEDIMARSYAKLFTTAEIKSITAFYVSPAGKKTLELTPQIMQESMPQIVALIQPKMNALVERTASEIVSKAAEGKDAKAAPATK